MMLYSDCREVLTGLSAFSYKDRIVVTRQMERHVFDHGLVISVSCRCRWGYPQTLLCKPFFKGIPFPTLFWLTCPYLSKLCGAIESAGGVGDLENFLKSHKSAYTVYNSLYASVRQQCLNKTEKHFLRMYRPKILRVLTQSGIGGIRQSDAATAKCLHLQTATFLSLYGHPAANWLRKRLKTFCCNNEQCR